MNADRLFALYNRVAEAPAAVSCLRRLVLDLAVRGKLVEQDPADEAASVLLKRIDSARKLAPTQGRKTKGAAIRSSLADTAFALPAGWARARLSQLVRVLNGRAYKKAELLDSGTPVLRVGNLFTSKHWYYSDLQLAEDKYCDEGDLLYAWSASFGPVIWQGPRVIFHYHIWKLSLFSEADLDKRFLYYLLLQQTQEIKSAGHGVSMVHMTKGKMERLPVPLPPRAEQCRIVAKVDELMAVCDQLEEARTAREDTRDRLTKASLNRLIASDIDAPTFRSHVRFAVDAFPAMTARADQVKHLRQTILNLAVRGKLVEQDPSDEPASELLKRIAEGKGKLGVKHEVKPLGVTEAPFRTPGGWHWSRIGELCTKTGSGSTPRGGKSVYKTNGVPFLRSQNVYDDGLRLANVAYIGGDVHARMAGTAVRARDLLLNITGGSMGRCCRVPDGFAEANVSQHVAIIRPAVSEMADYVHKFVLSPYFQAFIFRRQTGAGRGGLPKNRMDRIAVAVPPLAEQQRIVAKVDELMALCDRLEAGLGSAGDTRNRLLESLLQDTLTPPAYEAATAGVVGA